MDFRVLPMVPRFLLILTLVFSPLAQAALPSVVGGQRLPTLAPILEKALPGVVNISAQTVVRDRNPLFDDPFFRRFFDLPERRREAQSLGSGVIVDAGRGYIVTNHHVVEGADSILVKLHDGREVEAEVIGQDKKTDLAVIRIDEDNLQALPMGDSERLQVGDFVVAIGNPFGLNQTVTSGIVSALGRSGLSDENYEDYIQTDASINPGNSGGALIDLAGNLVGINTAIIAPGGGNVGIGFAIPVHMAREVMEQLIEHGKVRRGRLGIQVQALTPELAQALGAAENARGIVVVEVVEDSAAARAGLEPGDIVTAVAGRAVASLAEMRTRLGTLPVDKNIRIDVIRKGRPRALTAVVKAPRLRRMEAGEWSAYLRGVVLAEVLEDGSGRSGISGRFVVAEQVNRRSRAARAGIRPGDLFLSINGESVNNLDDVEDALSESDSLLLIIRRGGQRYRLLMR